MIQGSDQPVRDSTIGPWKSYAPSVLLPLIAAGGRAALGIHGPALDLFIIPILLSAFIGGWKAGLLATALSAAVGGRLAQDSGPATLAEVLGSHEWVNLVASGAVISSLAGLGHFVAGRAQAALRRANDSPDARAEARAGEPAPGHESFRRLVEQAPLSIAMFDREMRYLATSRRWVQEYGRGRNELTGLCHYDVHPDLKEAWKAVHARGLAGEVVTNDEDTWVQSDGSQIWLRWAVHPWRDARGAIGGIIISSEDFTPRKRAEEAVRRLNAELEQRVAARTAELESKNRELEAFAYSVSHDLKAPLRGIDGYSRLLAEQYTAKLDDDGRSLLGGVREGARQMGRLIDDLLAYSRVERRAKEIVWVRPRDVVQALVDERAAQIRSQGVRVTVDLADATVVIDREGLALAVRNLLDNALKFTRGVAQPAVTLTGTSRGDAYTIAVRDNGIGFDMKFHDRIFEIFQRLHATPDFPGTGIGLAIVRKAVERMGGRVWAESEPGRGASFSLELPGVGPPL
jgi:PAS domain S-box-containing protein